MGCTLRHVCARTLSGGQLVAQPIDITVFSASTMPQFCAVFGCSNRSNREKGKGYYRVPKVIVHRGEKWKKLSEQRRKKWIANLRLKTKGAETAYARVCGDHFVKGMCKKI